MSSFLHITRCGVLALAASLAACAVPDADDSIARSAAESKPVVQGAEGPLTPAASDALIKRLGSGAEGSEILQRHLQVEEGVAGSPLTTDNAVEVLRDGDQTFAAIGAAISGARQTLNLEYYTIEDVTLQTPDGNARALADMLVAKLQQGVSVNIIYDSYGSSDTPGAFFERLEKAGAKLLSFHPIDPNPANVINGNDRDHRKILVADGRVAVIGGVNLSKSYESKSPGSDDEDGEEDPQTGLPRHWRDTSIRIEGPAVAEIQKLFFVHWSEEGGAKIDQAPYFPKQQAKGGHIVRVIGSTPKQDVSRYYVTLISALRSAERKIWISNAYFVPTPDEMEALLDAARRGVDVRVMVPEQSDSPPAVEAARSHYSDLLEAGVKIFETRDVVLHSKTVTIDGVWSAVGSSNFDHRSVLFNDEIDAVILGKQTAEDLEAIFKEGEQTSNRIDQASWEAQRGFGERVRGFWSRMMEGLL
ncbi:phosphatidylserine/phosphatidylglycerophosphate/cardiolipin synthase family protein [Dongia sp.]|uniref:phospholipase D-like domain-containing protein n=1 Tax=Dongia sp. TaxID=1977262 RepID=UPI003751B0FE